MTLVKRPNWPTLFGEKWLTDFFDNDRFFDSDWMKIQAVPAVNVKESEKEFLLELAAPGLTKKDFNLRVDNGVLTISSEKEEEKEETKDNYTRREFSYASFSRSFALPENANEEEIKAVYDNGILKLAVAKKIIAVQKPRKAIEVR